jgi:hypothetical protein
MAAKKVLNLIIIYVLIFTQIRCGSPVIGPNVVQVLSLRLGSNLTFKNVLVLSLLALIGVNVRLDLGLAEFNSHKLTHIKLIECQVKGCGERLWRKV